MEKSGLEDVTVCRSSICHIDGANGLLLYRGYDVRDLAKHSTFEETAYLLLFGKLPTISQYKDFCAEITQQHGGLKNWLLAPIEQYDRGKTMPKLQAAVSLLALENNNARDLRSQAECLIGLMPHIINKCVDDSGPVYKRYDSYAGISLSKFMQERWPNVYECEVFDTCLILHMEHELNASTFAARIAASTGADMYASVSAAIGALSGPLHGGANKRVILMMKSVKTKEDIVRRIRQLLNDKKKIPGFGHRVYKQTPDPRAVILKDVAAELCQRNGAVDFYELFETAELLMAEEKGLKPNTDFWAACVYNQLGIPDYLFTPIFAMARTVGWAAHVLEQESDESNRIIRPRAEYTGEIQKTYIPMDERR